MCFVGRQCRHWNCSIAYDRNRRFFDSDTAGMRVKSDAERMRRKNERDLCAAIVHSLCTVDGER